MFVIFSQKWQFMKMKMKNLKFLGIQPHVTLPSSEGKVELGNFSWKWRKKTWELNEKGWNG